MRWIAVAALAGCVAPEAPVFEVVVATHDFSFGEPVFGADRGPRIQLVVNGMTHPGNTTVQLKNPTVGELRFDALDSGVRWFLRSAECAFNDSAKTVRVASSFLGPGDPVVDFTLEPPCRGNVQLGPVRVLD